MPPLTSPCALRLGCLVRPRPAVLLARPAAPAPGSAAVEIETPTFGRLCFERLLPGSYQPWNLACAVHALEFVPGVTGDAVVAGVAAARWPGRLETVRIAALVEGGVVLVDGAHNPQAQRELRNHVDTHLRNGKRVYWVLAATQGKDVDGMVRELVAEGDEVVATRFGDVDGMPWVHAVEPEEIVSANGGGLAIRDCIVAVRTAAERAKAENATVVVAGSLYLVGDLHRHLEAHKDMN